MYPPVIRLYTAKIEVWGDFAVFVPYIFIGPGEKYFAEKTRPNLCVDPDYHILGALDGVLKMMN